MIYKTQARLRLAVNNLMSLPTNPQVKATLESAPFATVVMIQEADLREFKEALGHLGAHRVPAGVPIPQGNTFSTFVLYDQTTWEHISTDFHKAYDGVGGVSLTRHVAETILRHRGINQEVAFLSYHAVTTGGDKVRRRLRKEGTAVVRGRIRALKRLGLPIFLGCDQNGTSNLFPSRRFHIRDGVIHLYAWHGKHVRLRLDGHHAIDTRSDHDTLVGRFTATVR